MMKTIWKTMLVTATVSFPGATMVHSQTTTPVPAGMVEKDDLRNARYCEILVAKREGMSATASVYSTLGLNDCPAIKWEALDAAKLKDELHASMVTLNGPRYFTMDRNAIASPGAVVNFDGLETRMLAQMEIKAKQNRTPYTENIVERDDQYLYDRGKNVYELLAPNGREYVMQSYSQEIDKNLNEEGLLTLEDRLKLPHGWEYRVRKLHEDMVVRNLGGKAHVVQDDLRNTYQLVE